MSIDAAAEEQFGPYLVYERLGVGGMATVHRALEQGAEGFERVVALKRLLPHLAEDASFIKSFVREAKLASILNHLNIVQIYELGRVGTEYFISMEYIDGRDLRRVLRHARKVTGPPPINISVGLMVQLCDALDYAHNKVDEDGHPLGLVHRDISPSNLLITTQGHLKIIDFGIAKAQSSQLRTQTGRVKGKLAYMAPEAVSGSRDLDSRSDIWACGVILHELLTARPLFASKNEYQTLLKVQRGDIMPPSTFNHACPPELDTIVFRALARDIGERYASAAELRDALLKLKLQKNLATGYRDISSWLDWAFGLEAPGGFPNMDSSGVSSPETPAKRHKTPRPQRTTEEDEAVEVVWGSGAAGSEVGPVVLEDVPDVSGKHRVRRDTQNDDHVDDIPTPLPSHGTMPTIYGAAGTGEKDLVVIARGSDEMRAQPQQRSGPHVIPRNITGPHQAMPTQARAGSPSQPPERRTPNPSQPPERRTPSRITSQGIVAKQTSKQTGPVPALDAPLVSDRIAAQRARDSEPPPTRKKQDSGQTTNPDAHRLQTQPDVHRLPTEPSRPVTMPPGLRHATATGETTPFRPQTDPGLSNEEMFSIEAGEALARVSEENMPTLSGVAPAGDEPTTSPSLKPIADLPNVPVVRFAKTVPPPMAGGLAEADRPPPSTKPGLGPVRANTAPRSPTHAKAPANVRIGESIAARAVKPKRGLLILGGIVIAAGAATAVVMLSSHSASKPSSSEATPARPAARETGMVKFMLEPADAEITIEGKVAHAGSPWSSELAAGVHQIEIRRQGYKAWLTSLELSANETQTLRVVLEPLTTGTAAVTGDASLTITTTPPGLEVLIDGKLQPQKTPFKGKLEVGPHKITVRQNGVEVWQQNLNAEAASDYEFNPSFTADKQRERAQRGPSPTKSTAALTALGMPDAQPAVAAKTDHQDPSPTWIKPGSAAAGSSAPTAVAAVVAPNETAPTAPIAPSVPTTTTKPPSPAPAPGAATTTPPPAPPKPAPAPAPAPQKITTPVPVTAPATTAAKHTGPPPIVAPTAVKKLSGDTPNVAKFHAVELPASLAAKVCIDESGRVMSADMVTKVEKRVSTDLTEQLRSWRYSPYLKAGTASPACFVVTFRSR